MTLTNSTLPDNGINSRFSLPTDVALPGSPCDFLSRLAELFVANEDLTAELGELRKKLDSAREYLGSPLANLALAEARLSQLRAKHSAALTRLRANRIQSRRLCALAPSPTLAVAV